MTLPPDAKRANQWEPATEELLNYSEEDEDDGWMPFRRAAPDFVSAL